MFEVRIPNENAEQERNTTILVGVCNLKSFLKNNTDLILAEDNRYPISLTKDYLIVAIPLTRPEEQ